MARNGRSDIDWQAEDIPWQVRFNNSPDVTTAESGQATTSVGLQGFRADPCALVRSIAEQWVDSQMFLIGNNPSRRRVELD